jgi:hypothetical protein
VPTVVTVKVPDVAPAGIVMLSGTVTTEVSQLVRDTVTPPAGAALVNVTVAVAVLPVLMVPGLTDRFANARLDVTVTTADSFTPLYDAVMVASESNETVPTVVTVKVPDVAPAGIVMVSGTVTTEVSQLVRDTVTPPAGAALVNATVAVVVLPALTVAGLTVRLANARLDITVSTAVSFTPLYVAVMLAPVFKEPVPAVVTGKVPDVAPAGIVILAGTVATAVSQLVRDTFTPPAGAAPVNVTVAIAVLPALTVVGLTEKLAKARLEVTASAAVSVALLYVALMIALTLPFAGVVVTLNVPAVLPALTVTVAGTMTAVLLLDSDITAPPGGAGPVRTVVRVDGLPAATLVGLIIISARVAAITVSVAVLSTPL